MARVAYSSENVSDSFANTSKIDSSCTDSVCDSYDNSVKSNRSIYNSVPQSSSSSKIGQSFSGSSGFIQTASFFIKKVVTTNLYGDIRAVLYAHTGTFGSSSLPTKMLAYSSWKSASTLSSSYTWVNFDFAWNNFRLDPSKKYVIGLEMANTDNGGGDSQNNVGVAVDTSSVSHAGNSCLFSDRWTAMSTFDLCFSVTARDYTFSDTYRSWYSRLNGDVSLIKEQPFIFDLFTNGGHEEAYSVSLGSSFYIGQSFMTYRDIVLDKASFHLLRLLSSYGGTITAYIYAHSGNYGYGTPSGSPIATSDTINNNSITNGLLTWKEIPFSGANRISLTALTPYFLVLFYSASAASTVSPRIEGAVNGYYNYNGGHNGNRVTSPNGSTWTIDTIKDLIFNVYGATEVYNTVENTVQSVKLNTSVSPNTVSLTATDTKPTGTSIDYFVSNNGGATWKDISSGAGDVALDSVGSDFRYKAVLNGTTSATPVVDNLSFTLKDQREVSMFQMF